MVSIKRALQFKRASELLSILFMVFGGILISVGYGELYKGLIGLIYILIGAIIWMVDE